MRSRARPQLGIVQSPGPDTRSTSKSQNRAEACQFSRMRQVHAKVRTTPLIRAEIKASELDVVEPAERFNVSRLTVAK